MKGHIRNIFPGGNTPQGFYSYYNDILPQRKAEKIFCIKGGAWYGQIDSDEGGRKPFCGTGRRCGLPLVLFRSGFFRRDRAEEAKDRIA